MGKCASGEAEAQHLCMRIMLVTSTLDQHLSPIAPNAAANTHFGMDIMSFSKTTMQFKQTIA
jgi:hypothetical protein